MRRPLRVVITAGPTREPIDPVRFLSNYSTGVMGAALARAALRRGHDVTVIAGPLQEPMPAKARVVPVERAREMQRALYQAARQADLVLMAAAVADFTVARPARRKLVREGTVLLRLTATPDIIGGLPRRPGQVVVGFALETDRVLARARAKLVSKRLDLVLAQSAARRPFGRRPVLAWLVRANGGCEPMGEASKQVIARTLLDKAERLWYGRNSGSSAAAAVQTRARQAVHA